MNIKEVVFQALGEASMCWSETPTGVFDGANAERIGNEVMAAIEAEKPSALAVEAIKGLLIQGVQTDGAHHKQYVLWQIAAVLDLDVASASDDKGIAP